MDGNLGSEAHETQPKEDKIVATRTRVNDAIRISPIRLIDADGSQVGIVSLEEAKAAAEAVGLDLVEISPTARPPVCRIMDYGKHLYEEQKKAREARKKQHTIDVKELKLRPGTEEHDLETKIRHARKFLEKGAKVKFSVRFRGREMAHPEIAREQLDEIATSLDDLGQIEVRDGRIEGKQMTMIVAPRKR